jgi:hypothetical protein
MYLGHEVTVMPLGLFSHLRAWRKLHDRRKLLPAHAAAWLAYCRRMLPALRLAGACTKMHI